MAQGLNNENYFGYERYLFINNTPIPAVQSFQANYPIPQSPIVALGGIDALFAPRDNKVGKASISTVLVSTDILYQMTGKNGNNIYLLKDLNNKFDNFCCISGYLTSYNHQYSIGGLPQVNANFDVFYNIGLIDESNLNHLTSEINSLSYTSTGLFQDIHIGCATFNINDFDDNPLIGYEINISCPRVPIYCINRDTPKHVIAGKPIDLTLNLQMEESYYQYYNMKNYPNSIPTKNISITLKNKNGQTVNRYVFGSMSLVNVSKQISTDSPDIINLNYRTSI